MVLKRVSKLLQNVLFICGPIIITLLFFAPSIGNFFIWNILIPSAPLLLFLLPGLWRNICPMGTTAILPTKLNIGKKIKY